jgi:hypothetical protein
MTISKGSRPSARSSTSPNALSQTGSSMCYELWSKMLSSWLLIIIFGVGEAGTEILEVG